MTQQRRECEKCDDPMSGIGTRGYAQERREAEYEDWEMCGDCCGDGIAGHDCGEDTCCCADPVDNQTCQTCDGKGGWKS